MRQPAYCQQQQDGDRQLLLQLLLLLIAVDADAELDQHVAGVRERWTENCIVCGYL